ncbi:MAG: hypothetical protein FH758_03905 [Firmicutes bacterium]|nr:hypothetical protein [Bacillota bacterium]
MKESGQRDQQQANKDSVFAFGTSMRPSRLSNEIESQDFNGRAFDVLEYLSETEALTVSAATNLLKKSRFVASKSFNCLWYAGLVRWVTVAANAAVFKLWLTTDVRLPNNAAEACRMAALGLYYSHAKKEVPGFEWRLVRSNKKPTFAEMSYLPKGQTEKVKMIIDAPRRKEKPNPDASLYIFPTVNEAKELVPKGKRFTSDLHLMQHDNSTLTQKLFEIS